MPRRARAWRRLLDGGLTLDEAVAVSFLISPDLQLSLEKIEVARSDLVAAGTPPNPLLVIGMRDTGGNFSAYYPSDNLSVGILQNVIGLLNMPDRMAVAGHELERARLESAQRITTHGVLVAQSWLEYSAALRVQELRNRSVAAAHVQRWIQWSCRRANGNRFTPLDVAVERSARVFRGGFGAACRSRHGHCARPTGRAAGAFRLARRLATCRQPAAVARQ